MIGRFSLVRHLPFVAVALAAAAGSSLSAQWPSEVAPGARVQVRLPELQYQIGNQRGQLIRGRVAHLANDTLYLAVSDSLGPLAVPRSYIQRLEISHGVPSRGVSALKHGLISGVSLGLTLGLLAEIDSGGDDFEDGALMGGAVGLAVGGILGALRPLERWKRVKPW